LALDQPVLANGPVRRSPGVLDPRMPHESGRHYVAVEVPLVSRDRIRFFFDPPCHFLGEVRLHRNVRQALADQGPDEVGPRGTIASAFELRGRVGDPRSREPTQTGLTPFVCAVSDHCLRFLSTWRTHSAYAFRLIWSSDVTLAHFRNLGISTPTSSISDCR